MDKVSQPDPVDIIVGERLRAARRAARMSQEDLGRACGITFQQIQKYERGTNRVSASMMVRAARALKIAAASLLPDEEAAEEAQTAAASDLITPQLRRAVEACPGLSLLGELPLSAQRDIEKYVRYQRAAQVHAADGAPSATSPAGAAVN